MNETQALQQELMAVKAASFDEIMSLKMSLREAQGTLRELCSFAGVKSVQELAAKLKESEEAE